MMGYSFTNCFNTQPPEGGWQFLTQPVWQQRCFNTQPPEGGWVFFITLIHLIAHVSTHSRPKAAGSHQMCRVGIFISFNTQPPEGGWSVTETQFKWWLKFQHTAARRRLEPLLKALFHQVSQPRFR